jgi:DNA-directed RNA polymerase subunit RPC12/RpoP
MMPIILVGAVIVLAVGGCAWARTRSRHTPEPRSFRCPHCGQKLRSQLNRASRAVTCPGCKHHFTLPADPQATPAAGTPVEGYRLRRKDEPKRTMAEAGKRGIQP